MFHNSNHWDWNSTFGALCFKTFTQYYSNYPDSVTQTLIRVTMINKASRQKFYTLQFRYVLHCLSLSVQKLFAVNQLHCLHELSKTRQDSIPSYCWSDYRCRCYWSSPPRLFVTVASFLYCPITLILNSCIWLSWRSRQCLHNTDFAALLLYSSKCCFPRVNAFFDVSPWYTFSQLTHVIA